MEDFTLTTLLAVFEEMFGRWLFWGLVALALAITLAFFYVLIRDRGLESRKLVRAELTAPVGAIAAILFVQWITNSAFRDIGGPIDWLVLLGIGVAGAGGLTLLIYVLQALATRRPRES